MHLFTPTQQVSVHEGCDTDLLCWLACKCMLPRRTAVVCDCGRIPCRLGARGVPPRRHRSQMPSAGNTGSAAVTSAHAMTSTARRSTLAADAEQVPVEVFSESAADTVQCYRVDTRVDEAQAESDNAECVPETIKLFHSSILIAVEPQHEDMLGEKAHSKDYDESKDHLCNFLPGSDLSRLTLNLPRHVSGTKDEMSCHKKIKERDNYQWDGVVDDKLGDHYGLCVHFTPRNSEWVTDVETFRLADFEYSYVRCYCSWHCTNDG